MKTAIVHDQLLEFGGAERVLVFLKEIFKKADVFTSYYNPKTLGVQADKFKDWQINTFWLDKIPFSQKFHSPLRFLNPIFWEAYDLTDYDLVISSSGSFMSKGVITRPETVHICYLHHPPRYLYYYETAIEWQKYLPVRIYGHLVNHRLRVWDYLSSQRVDYFIANSDETKARIKKFYRRDCQVIYPPVEIPDDKEIKSAKWEVGNYYLTVSRLMRSKHVDVSVEAANKGQFNLKIVGQGRVEDELKKKAGPTVEFLGEVKDKEFKQLFLKAKAFLFASKDEEFGIAPVEAMGWGLPVLAFQSGGVKETVEDGVNGFFFNQLAPLSLLKKIKKLEKLSKEKYLKMREQARKTSEKFSKEQFKKKFLHFANSKFNPD